MPGEASEMRGKGQGMGKGMGDGPMGKPMVAQKEMFAADFPEFDKVEKRVDMLVDSAMAECGVDDGDDNELQNSQSDDAEEELGRLHSDIAGYGDPEDTEKEYAGGTTGLKAHMDDEEEMYGHGGMGMQERVQLEFLLHEEDYKEFFRSMMDKFGITSLKGLPVEKKKEFFSQVGAAWRSKKEGGEKEGIDESSVLIAAAIAGGVILIPHFRRIRKLKQAAKNKCQQLTGDANKRCLTQVDIVALKKQISETRKGLSSCSKNKNPEKCRKLLNGIIKDFENKIKEKQRKLAAI